MNMYLYRKVRQVVTLMMAMAAISPLATGQFRAPQPERKTPRAVGVLETYPSGVRRLVPVTFFYERHYYDAGLYRATPVPFTLAGETLYEVQQFGKAVGTFTVMNAVHSQSAALDASQWFGNGRYKTAAPPRAKKAPAAVVVADSSRPVLHRRAGSEGDNPVAHPTQTAEKAEEEDDPDRPKLHRRESADEGKTAAGAVSPTAGAGAAAGAGTPAEPPTAISASAGAVKPTAEGEGTASDDAAHPILRRGKPMREQSGADLPEFTATSEARGGSMGGSSGGRRDAAVTRQVAVSDAGPSTETQTLIYVCHEEERKQMEASARELAQAELRRLAAQRGLVLPAAVAATAKAVPAKASGAKASAAKKKAAAEQALPEMKMEEEQFVPYELDYNNYATVVFSARYAPAVTEAVAASDAGSDTASDAAKNAGAASAMGRSWVVTVIAREDEGKLVKLYSAVSDPRELDLYPEVRLVDAVDPDGYGRYGLLLREQKRDGVSWLLGRPSGYELQTVFETAVR